MNKVRMYKIGIFEKKSKSGMALTVLFFSFHVVWGEELMHESTTHTIARTEAVAQNRIKSKIHPELIFRINKSPVLSFEFRKLIAVGLFELSH